MLDRNPLHSKHDPNDCVYTLCITDHLYGPLDAYATQALAQVHRGQISARFAMIAMARLSHQIERARRQRLGLD